MGGISRRVHPQDRKIIVPESGTERETGGDSGYLYAFFKKGIKNRAAPVKGAVLFYNNKSKNVYNIFIILVK